MAKKAKANELVVPENEKATDVVFDEFDSNATDVVSFAVQLGVDLGLDLSARADEAAYRMNRSQTNMLAAGLLLLSIKTEVGHGGFTELIESRGFQLRGAQRAMSYAKYMLQQPEAERDRLIGMPNGKVLALAGADPEVIEALSASGERIEQLSVAELRSRIRELEAAAVDKDAAKQAAEAERDAALKKLDKSKPDRGDQVPVVFADLRAEVVAIEQKMKLCIDSVIGLTSDLDKLADLDDAEPWVATTISLVFGSLAAIHHQLQSAMVVITSDYHLDPKDMPRGVEVALKLSPQELREHANAFADFKSEHEYEAAIRDWDREQSRPQGKGRPRSKPEAPKGKKA